MPRQMEVQELLNLVRRNEQIQRRLDQVEDFLLAHHDLASLLRHLARQVAQVYELEAATLVLSRDNQRLGEALAGPEAPDLPEGCLWRPRKELRVLLGDIERPYLSNRVTPELGQCFFPGGEPLGSLGVIPLWVRDEMRERWPWARPSPSASTPTWAPISWSAWASRPPGPWMRPCSCGKASSLSAARRPWRWPGRPATNCPSRWTTLTLQLDLLLRGIGDDDPRRATLLGLMANAERMGELVKRIRQVSKYVTRPYAQGLRIIDVEAASAPASAGAAGGEK